MTTPAALQLCTQLAGHLDNELALQRGLMQIAELKQQVLVRNDGAALAKLVEKEQPVLAEAARLRPVRERLVHAVSAALGVADGTRLEQIAASAPAQFRTALATKGRELRTLVERLRDLNDRNQLLIRQGLGLVRELLDLFLPAPPTPAAATYDRRGYGARPATPAGGLFSVKV
jgi:flagellar biosynthesis/type III secretory pathway chaperone